MSELLIDGVIRKLWIDRAGPYRDHLLRLDAESRRNRFGGAVSDEFAKAHPDVVDTWRQQEARALKLIHDDPAAAAKAIAAEIGLSPDEVTGQLKQGVYLTPEEVASPEWLGSEGKPGNIAVNLQSASQFLADQKQIPSAASLQIFQDAIYTKGLPGAITQ